MTRTNYIVAARADERHAMALSSVVHAMLETNSYAVARLVRKQDDKPVMLLLAPSVEPGYECLVDSELPFAEDMRYFNFPPLDRVITVSGKQILEHRNLPSKELMKSMSDYVDAMDLSDFGRNESGYVCLYQFSPT
jgi:ATP-dependent DNA helicase 2 subunit 2